MDRLVRSSISQVQTPSVQSEDSTIPNAILNHYHCFIFHFEQNGRETTHMPKQPLIFECGSVNRRIIRLTEKVWRDKILKGHPEFNERAKEYSQEVKKTIEDPEYVVVG